MNSRRSITLFLAGIALLVAAHFAVDLSGRGTRPSERRSSLISLDPEHVRRITVERCGERPIGLERGETGWRIATPFSAAADERAVNRLLDALAYVPVSESVSGAELASMNRDRSDFQLDEPVAAVTVSDGDKSETISVGAPTPTADGVYADVSDIDAVFVAQPAVLAAIDIPPESLRRRSLFDSEPAAIISFGIKLGRGDVTSFKFGETGWSTKNATVSAEKVKSFLSGLTAAEAKGFVWPVGATNETQSLYDEHLAIWGLDPETAVTVMLKDAAGAERHVSFGKNAGDGLAYARAQNGAAIVTVSAALKDAAESGPSTFRDSRVFQIDIRDVTAFTVTDGGVSHALTRNSDGAWLLESPIAAPADKTTAEEMLARLLALTAADIDENGITVSLSPGTKQLRVLRKSVLGNARYEDLRSREAVRIDHALVRRIVRTTKNDTASAVYDRDRRTWGVEAGKTEISVDESAVQAILSALNPLTAERIEKLKVAAADLSVYGLDSPAVTLSIDQTREDAVRRNLMIGGRAAGGGRYATVGSSDAIFIISDSAADILSRKITKQPAPAGAGVLE